MPDGDLFLFFFLTETRVVINRGRTAVLTKHRIALSSLSVPLGLPWLAFCFEQLLIQSVPHSRPHSRTGPKPCWMRDDDESTRVNWIRKRFLLLNRRHRYLTVLFATAPCDVALEFRSETAFFFPPPPFCRFAVIYHNPTFSSSYLSSPSIDRPRARSNEISHC